MNNNQYNKCKYHENPNHYYFLSNDHLINYIWGQLDDFESSVKAGLVINGCHKRLFHSKIYTGRRPLASGVYYNGNGQLQALIAHDGVEFDDLPLTSRLFCGETGLSLPDGFISSTSLYIHSLDVVDFDLFKNF